MLGFGTLAVLVLQGLAALAIIVHFRRNRDPRWWSTFIAPGIGFLGLVTIIVLAIVNFDIVAGSSDLRSGSCRCCWSSPSSAASSTAHT